MSNATINRPMLYKNILLIDDDSDDAEIFVEAVDSLQKQIICRTSNNALKSFEGLKIAEDLPDLVFVDFSMPALNGREFIEKMKSVKRLQYIPIILMSSHAVEVLCELTQKLEGVSYMTKPNSFQELVIKLNEVLTKMQD
ncbi:response regulator [Flavobacterium sp.]|uniref:response regulator n=1 Tax=Flavobacterium sp. TaxID=239 RepID=UPI003263FEB5